MQFDVIIIGGGIVGLSTAYRLMLSKPGIKLAIIEKEASLAAHQTGHNSGVIHSGIYYKPGSLKAKNCISGYNMLLDFCNENNIKYDLCGKLIIASNDAEITELDKLYIRGQENGLNKIKYVERDEIANYEPHVKGVRGINVPYTGIIDFTDVCIKLAEKCEELGADIFLSHQVENINKKSGFVEIVTAQKTFATSQLVNCGGLYCDKIAAMTQKSIDTRVIPFRGEYYMLKPAKRHLVKNLVYPVPDPNFPFLGVHFTRMIDNSVEAGPNAVFAFKREGYAMSDVDLVEMCESLFWPGFRKVMQKYWKTGIGEFYRSFSKPAFTKALQKLIPEVQEDDLIPAESGVRAQACDKFGGLIDDFKIIEESGIIHILNAPSPAATSGLAIGQSITEMILKRI